MTIDKRHIAELLADMLNYIHDMVFIIRIEDGYIEYVNQTAIDNFGYTYEEMNEFGIEKFRRTIEKHDSFADHLQELKETGSLTDYAYIVRKDGTEFPIEVNAKHIQMNGIDYNLAVVRDITERVHLMEKIHNQAIQTQNYLDISQVLIMALDNDKNVIMINQTGADMLGYSKEEIIGKNFIENFLPQHIRDEIKRVAKGVVEEDKEFSRYENPILTKSGEERLLSWRNTGLTDDNGNIVGVLTAGEDITEIRKKETQLLLHTKQAQLGEMLGMIAHQWRQPLSSIAATISSLKIKQALGNYDENDFSRQLDNIEMYTQHLSKTIDDFRNFFKEDKRKTEVTLTQVINRAVDIVQEIFTNKGIELKRDFAVNEELSMYANEFTQVILNLLKNAQEAIVERDIKQPLIEIKTYKEQGRFYITIQDNAGGIPTDIIEKIFDPYFTTKGDLNGTGLGLYMSKTIIEEHCRGHIEVKNVNGGTLFLISMNKRV